MEQERGNIPSRQGRSHVSPRERERGRKLLFFICCIFFVLSIMGVFIMWEMTVTVSSTLCPAPHYRAVAASQDRG